MWTGNSVRPESSTSPLVLGLLYTCAFCILVAAGTFVRNLVNIDRSYELFVRWPARLFLYCVLFLIVPPVGLAIGLWLLLLGNSQEQRKFGKGAFFVSLVYLVVHLTIFFGLSSTLTHYISR
jgi:hypothetical protein